MDESLFWAMLCEIDVQGGNVHWRADSHEPVLGRPWGGLCSAVCWELPDGDILQDIVLAVVILSSLQRFHHG